MRDIVVGVFANYRWDDVRPWAESLVSSGFQGDKIAITYNVDDVTQKKLHQLGFKVVNRAIHYLHEANIVVQRFYDIVDVCKEWQNDDVRLITTDVGDVIFQKNPSEWLDRYVTDGETIIASGEGLKYKDEPWNRNNLGRVFGKAKLEELQDREVCCAGVIAGNIDIVLRLFQDIWMLCQDKPQFVTGGGGPDQAAYNVLINGAYEANTIVACHDRDWACQMGTTEPAIKAYSGSIGYAYQVTPKEKKPDYLKRLIWPNINITDGKVYNYNKELFHIIHQYNRVPSLRQIVTGEQMVIDGDNIRLRIGE